MPEYISLEEYREIILNYIRYARNRSDLIKARVAIEETRKEMLEVLQNFDALSKQLVEAIEERYEAIGDAKVYNMASIAERSKWEKIKPIPVEDRPAHGNLSG